MRSISAGLNAPSALMLTAVLRCQAHLERPDAAAAWSSCSSRDAADSGGAAAAIATATAIATAAAAAAITMELRSVVLSMLPRSREILIKLLPR